MLYNIKAEHVRKAAEEVDLKGVTNRHRESVKYQVIIGDKKYSPKYIISLAHKYTEEGTELNPKDFGTNQANHYLTQLGFFITEVLSARGGSLNTKYYIISGPSASQLQAFIEQEIWLSKAGENYYGLINSIPLGAQLVARTSIVKRGKRNGSSNTYQICAIGNVTSNYKDGKTIGVSWEKNFIPFSFESKNDYTFKVIYEIMNKDEKKQILNRPIIDSKHTSSNVVNHHKNTILYGPPGTGKTYNTIDLAVEIVTGAKASSHAASKQQFDALLHNQIEFITFHQNYSYEDFVMGLKPDTSGEDGGLKFRKHEGIFYKLAQKARQNYEASQLTPAGTGLRPFNEVFAELAAPLIENEEEINLQTVTGKTFTLYEITKTSIRFRKSSGSTLHTLSRATLQEYYDGTRDVTEETGLWVYYRPLIDRLQEMGRISQPVPRKNYVLIIDEINRANMSRVLGELITLLEDDKRLGGENEIRLLLPSGERFGVPPNLYLIGTMNTADKSLALLDIALRRRFEFRYLKPNPDLLDEPARSILHKLNKSIRDSHRPADFLIGHAYFIGKSAEALPEVFNNRVIPLLMEYFNGRLDDVAKILTEAGVQVERDDVTDQLTFVSHVG